MWSWSTLGSCILIVYVSLIFLWLYLNGGRLLQVDQPSPEVQTDKYLNPFVTLNISRNATEDEIRAAYKPLKKQYHPDKAGENDRYLQIQAAVDLLRESSLYERCLLDRDYKYDILDEESVRNNREAYLKLEAECEMEQDRRFEAEVERQKRRSPLERCLDEAEQASGDDGDCLLCHQRVCLGEEEKRIESEKQQAARRSEAEEKHLACDWRQGRRLQAESELGGIMRLLDMCLHHAVHVWATDGGGPESLDQRLEDCHDDEDKRHDAAQQKACVEGPDGCPLRLKSLENMSLRERCLYSAEYHVPGRDEAPAPGKKDFLRSQCDLEERERQDQHQGEQWQDVADESQELKHEKKAQTIMITWEPRDPWYKLKVGVGWAIFLGATGSLLNWLL